MTTGRSGEPAILEGLEREFPRSGIDGADRAFAAFFGTVMAVFWPVALPVRAAWQATNRKGLLQTSKEKADADRQELDALRRLAREHHLPMPESKQ